MMKIARCSFPVLVLTLVGCGGSSAQGADPATPDQVEDNSVDPDWDPGEADREAADTLSIDDQVALGATLFAPKCGTCHGEKGEGSDSAPAIVGDDALKDYDTAQDLFAFVSGQMPPGDAEKLANDEYWGIVAYLTKQQGVKPDAPLGPDTASGVLLAGGETEE